jgi:hypothetical protein
MSRRRAGNSHRHSSVASVAWGWRWEAALGLAAGLTFRAGTVLLGGFGGGLLVLGLATIPLAVFAACREWLCELLEARSVDRWFSKALRACGVVGSSGARPVVRSSERVPVGLRLVVEVPSGRHTGHLLGAAPALAAALHAREVRVIRDAGDAALARVSVVQRNPFAGAQPLRWPGLEVPRTSLWEPVPLGIDEDGVVVWISLPEHNLLLGGEPGAGKSVALSLLVAAAALDPSVSLTLLDGKQVELAAWADCAERFVGSDLEEAALALADLQGEMDARYERLVAERRRKVGPGDGIPLHVVVVDELALYLRSGDRTKRAELTEAFRDLVSRGRAAGIVVLAATQKPSHEIVPTWIRDLFGFRLALRCTTPEASDTVLGQGWASQGYSAATVGSAERGVGLLLHESSAPVKLRTFFLGDDEVATLASRAGTLRERW